jgi:hypothetical protein
MTGAQREPRPVLEHRTRPKPKKGFTIMTKVTLPKLDKTGNTIPDESPPTVEELRRDLANGKRVVHMEQDLSMFVDGDPNGDLDGDAFRAILAKEAETNIAAQVALEDWDAREAGAKSRLAPPNQIKAAVEELFSFVPRKVRQAKRVDPTKMAVAFNLMLHSVNPKDQGSKVQSLMDYACGQIEWDELEADLEGRQCVRGEWKKTRIAKSDQPTKTRH